MDTDYKETFRNCRPGDVVRFGKYEWSVYARDDDTVSLLCMDSVREGTYHSANTAMTWENCDLRKWLNGEFYDQFTPEEKKLIARTHLSNPMNFPYLTRGGRPTDDYVFLLSIKEAKKIDQSMLSFDTIWWLRSPGYQQDRAADVFTNGLICNKGSLFLHRFHAVRPVLNIATVDL